ncbi:MAG: phosphatase domain-containing protein [Thiogranum sp.]|nr:phosphatase domain-containing protein [Thiogranum sp.]
MSELKLPVSIQPFRGFGNGRMVCVNGQVTFGRRAHMRRPIGRDEQRRLWTRIVDATRLAISPRIPGARVRIHCGGAVREVTADTHGHFSACLELPPRNVRSLWREYLVELVEPKRQESVTGRGEILVATAAARRIIVSDIDDTVIFTGVSNKLRMLWQLFARGPHDRVPFPGIAALYRGLYAGPDAEEKNPLIYISRSPWSIYPTLEEFFQLHDIPIGPVLQLRDWGITLRHPFPRRAPGQKREVLERVLTVYPELPLLLIGDSGQHDPELYLGLARQQPARVAGIYIRDLRLSRRRTRELAAMQAELAALDVPMLAAPTSAEIAVDAAQRGWISGSTLAQVHERVEQDTA